MITSYTHSLIFSWGFNVIYVTLFSLSYFGLPFFIVFLLIFLISTYFLISYSSFSSKVYSLYFLTSFLEVHSIETGSHALYMQWSTSFLLVKILVTCHTHRPIFITFLTFFIQMFHVNMLQYLFQLQWFFIVWKAFFMLFSPYFLFFKSHLPYNFFLLNVVLVIFDLII